jgi:hypothetical protein
MFPVPYLVKLEPVDLTVHDHGVSSYQSDGGDGTRFLHLHAEVQSGPRHCGCRGLKRDLIRDSGRLNVCRSHLSPKLSGLFFVFEFLVDLELKPNENCGDTGYCGKDDHEKLNPLIRFWNSSCYWLYFGRLCGLHNRPTS